MVQGPRGTQVFCESLLHTLHVKCRYLNFGMKPGSPMFAVGLLLLLTFVPDSTNALTAISSWTQGHGAFLLSHVQNDAVYT